MDEVEQQAEAARRYESLIAAVEPFVIQNEDGTFSFSEADLALLSDDTEAIDSLVASVDDLNSALSDSSLAVGEIQTATDFAHG